MTFDNNHWFYFNVIRFCVRTLTYEIDDEQNINSRFFSQLFEMVKNDLTLEKKKKLNLFFMGKILGR